MRIGAHTSIAKSLENAALTAARIGGNTFQIFSASPRMWRAPPPAESAVKLLNRVREKHDLYPLVIHDNYLINLASCSETLRAQSTAAFRGEIERALLIGAEYLVAHPGNCKGHSVEEGIYAVIQSLAEAANGLDHRKLTVLLENTAGSGAALGSHFEELSVMRQFAAELTDLKIGFCIDTCHCLASGYDISTADGLKKTVAQIDHLLGLDNVKVIHTNDSKTGLNSHVDRHEHIGHGYIGMEGFRRILNHPKLRQKAFILETPIDEEGDDVRNIETLKKLCRKSRTKNWGQYKYNQTPISGSSKYVCHTMEEVVVARFLLSLFLLLPAWAGEPEKTVIFGRGSHGTPVPAFDQGYLLFTMHGSGFEVWGPDGFLRFFASVENPPGASVTTLAVDSDGSVAAGFAYLGPQAISGGIAYFDPSGKQTQFVDTGKYMPAHVCFDHDHSLWTFGWQRDPSSDYQETRDYMMFRKYSGGKETGLYGPRSIMPARGLEPGSPSLGLWRLRIANDRVGAMAYSGATSANRVWIELGLDGHLIGKWAMGRDLQGGLAFTSSARLCRQTPAGKAKTPGIECLDRGTSAWEHAGDSPVPGLLLGADGDELVFSRNDSVITLHWAKVP